MSVVTDILDRLSGVAVARAKLDETLQRVDKVGDWLLDHERRLVELETHQKLLGSPRGQKR